MSYKTESLKHDLKGGIAVAAVSLPIGVAYSELLKLPPESGIYVAVFSLIAYFFLGTSRELIIGPDSATVALLASSLLALGNAGKEIHLQFVVLTTIVAGILFFIAGILKLGFISNFLSRPILIGFLNGVGVVLIIGQLQKFTGVPVADGNSIRGLFQFLANIGSIHFATVITGIVSLSLIGLLKMFSQKFPSQLAVILLSVIATLYFGLNNIGLNFTPEISGGLPSVVIPDLEFLEKNFSVIFIDASAILFLSFTNTVLVGKALTRNRHEYDPDREFYALGAADVLCGMFKGFPASASSSRTVLNIISGGMTKYSMLLAAVVMMSIVFFFSKEFALIPAAVFAAIIIDSGQSIIRLKEFVEIRNYSKEEFRVAIVCMIGVMVIGVLDGILIAILASFLILIKKTSAPLEYEMVYNPKSGNAEKVNSDNRMLIKDDTFFYRFNAAMLFFNFDFFQKKLLERINERSEVRTVIIDASPVNYIDITFRDNLVELISELDAKGLKIAFVNAIGSFEKKVSEGLRIRKIDSVVFYDNFKSVNLSPEIST